MALVYLGLGSNLADRLGNIMRAKDELALSNKIELIKESAIEETEPVDFLHQPKFLNQIVLIDTEIAPIELLRLLEQIEMRLGRRRSLPKGPRIIDMDILLYDDLILNVKDLRIPHPEIIKRRFILKHLIEINPELIDPQTGIRYIDIYSR